MKKVKELNYKSLLVAALGVLLELRRCGRFFSGAIEFDFHDVNAISGDEFKKKIDDLFVQIHEQTELKGFYNSHGGSWHFLDFHLLNDLVGDLVSVSIIDDSENQFRNRGLKKGGLVNVPSNIDGESVLEDELECCVPFTKMDEFIGHIPKFNPVLCSNNHNT